MLALQVTAFQTGLVLAVVATATAFIGARAEFHRSQRLKAYSEFTGAFVAAVNAGTALGSAALQLGVDGVRRDERVQALWEQWGPAYESYQRAKALLDLLATDRTRSAANSVHQFLTDNVLKAPPFIPGDELKAAGRYAKQGPGPVAREISNQVAAFVAVARKDLIGKRWRPGRILSGADVT